jgi:hypothetical protein
MRWATWSTKTGMGGGREEEEDEPLPRSGGRADDEDEGGAGAAAAVSVDSAAYCPRAGPAAHQSAARRGAMRDADVVWRAAHLKPVAAALAATEAAAAAPGVAQRESMGARRQEREGACRSGEGRADDGGLCERTEGAIARLSDYGVPSPLHHNSLHRASSRTRTPHPQFPSSELLTRPCSAQPARARGWRRARPPPRPRPRPQPRPPLPLPPRSTPRSRSAAAASGPSTRPWTAMISRMQRACATARRSPTRPSAR